MASCVGGLQQGYGVCHVVGANARAAVVPFVDRATAPAVDPIAPGPAFVRFRQGCVRGGARLRRAGCRISSLERIEVGLFLGEKTWRKPNRNRWPVVGFGRGWFVDSGPASIRNRLGSG